MNGIQENCAVREVQSWITFLKNKDQETKKIFEVSVTNFSKKRTINETGTKEILFYS
jgi:hypothetical protein